MTIFSLIKCQLSNCRWWKLMPNLNSSSIVFPKISIGERLLCHIIFRKKIFITILSEWKFTWSGNLSTNLFWNWNRLFKRHFNKESHNLLFSAISIWFSRSPLSVVSACSTFQLKFSISASSWACWYSNWK